MIRMFAAPAAFPSGICLSGVAARAATDLVLNGSRR